MAAEAGLGQLQYIECVFADYNNDGFPDIFCTDSQAGYVPSDILLKNNGDGTFTNVSTQAGIFPLIDGRSICWGDYNNDGNLDLFISRGTENGALMQTLYRNNGDGTFTDVTDQAGVGTSSMPAQRHGETLITTATWTCMWSIPGVIPMGKGPNYLYMNNEMGHSPMWQAAWVWMTWW